MIPVYEAKINDEEWAGILNIALVDSPAFETGLAKFSNQEPVPTIYFNKEQHSVVGAVIIPDKLIYRVDDNGYEYYVKYSKEVIELLRDDMMSKGTNANFNLHHETDAAKWKVTCQEVWIKESNNDKSIDYGFDLPIGTLFMKAKINDMNLWDRVKANEFNGFSMEVINNFQYKYMTEKQQFNSEVVIEENVAIEEPVVETTVDETTEEQPAETIEVTPLNNEEIEQLKADINTMQNSIKELMDVVNGFKAIAEENNSLKADLDNLTEKFALQNLASKQTEVSEEKVAEPVKYNKVDIISKLKHKFK
jgi:hypothetical protein